jgi:hypothetical protein
VDGEMSGSQATDVFKTSSFTKMKNSNKYKNLVLLHRFSFFLACIMPYPSRFQLKFAKAALQLYISRVDIFNLFLNPGFTKMKNSNKYKNLVLLH